MVLLRKSNEYENIFGFSVKNANTHKHPLHFAQSPSAALFRVSWPGNPVSVIAFRAGIVGQMNPFGPETGISRSLTSHHGTRDGFSRLP